ncbi:hypothetical protein BSU04_31045 [Caballeronia sordidicola]|uniref:Uncharacterized protein n=1 Tax=Caballeronia sordidicola TaxID=196367 RepID=A0A226WVW9_CABSO|nr:hypothetical protein BSU04_31045 [Caballeronia sordidicola]
MLLANERSERFGPPLACENLIGHAEIVSATSRGKSVSPRGTRLRKRRAGTCTAYGRSGFSGSEKRG